MNKALVMLVALVISGAANVHAGRLPEQDRTVVVYYFHRTVRCPSCTMLEELTREVLECDFEQALKTGKIKMKSINVDEKNNERFLKDYRLNAQSVVLSAIDNEKELRWKNLDQVWELIGDTDRLWEYLRKEMEDYLNPKADTVK